MPGQIADAILTYARRDNVTQIIIAKSERPPWFELLHGSVVRDLIRNSGPISVTAVSLRGETIPAKNVKTAPGMQPIYWRGYLLSAGAVAGTVGVAFIMNMVSVRVLGSLGMVFLVPVLISAVFFGRRTAFVTALLSVMAYNFFFLPPLYTFTIADPNNWLSFSVLLFVAIIAGNLAARVRAQADLAAGRAAALTELYRFTGKLAGIARLDDILWTASVQIASMLNTNVVIFRPSGRRPGGAGFRRRMNSMSRILPRRHGGHSRPDVTRYLAGRQAAFRRCGPGRVGWRRGSAAT